MKKKNAFTLAEVLITLGIIGVVAALTLPAIVQKNYEKETVARVKKAYSILQQAYLMASQKDGTPDEWGATGMYETSSHIFLANKFAPYIKITTNCVGMNNEEVKKICTAIYFDTTSYASYKIADGTTFIFRIWDGQCNGQYGSTKQLKDVCGRIMVDVNATGKPNILGKDIFNFYITKSGIYPTGTEFDRLSMKDYCTKSREWGGAYNSYYNGVACAAWVLYKENMDYLRCELDWDSGKKSCKK